MSYKNIDLGEFADELISRFLVATMFVILGFGQALLLSEYVTEHSIEAGQIDNLFSIFGVLLIVYLLIPFFGVFWHLRDQTVVKIMLVMLGGYVAYRILNLVLLVL